MSSIYYVIWWINWKLFNTKAVSTHDWNIHCNVLVYHYLHSHHQLTAQASTPSTAAPTNIELIEEDDILSFVEADNTHISSGSPMKYIYRKTSPTMFCVSLTEINVFIHTLVANISRARPIFRKANLLSLAIQRYWRCESPATCVFLSSQSCFFVHLLVGLNQLHMLKNFPEMLSKIFTY